jgi:L-asparagine transporter-like permease
MWLFPWLTYLAIAGMIAVLAAMAITPARSIEFWTSAVSVAVTLAAYALLRRNRGARS